MCEVVEITRVYFDVETFPFSDFCEESGIAGLLTTVEF